MEGDEAPADLAPPTNLGATKYVHAAFFVVGIVTGLRYRPHTWSAIWNALAAWPAAVRAVPQLLLYGEDERPVVHDRGRASWSASWSSFSLFRNPGVRKWSDDVATELSKVVWPNREAVTNGTHRGDRRERASRPSTSGFSIAFGVSSRHWCTAHDERNRKQTDGRRDLRRAAPDEVVRRHHVLGLREQGEAGACTSASVSTRWKSRFGEMLIPSESVTVPAKTARAAFETKTTLPRVRVRRDADERGGLASRQGDAEGHRLHRQPAAARSEAAAHRRSAQGHHRGRGQAEAPSAVLRRATRFASSSARSPTSPAPSRK